MTILLLVAPCLYCVSYAACSEGAAHDQSGLCVIDPFMRPPFLGFEHWSEVGIALGVGATGLLLAAVMLRRNNSN
jgi:hypothetical protein